MESGNQATKVLSELDEVQLILCSVAHVGTRFGYFRCFANRFRLPRESLHQVTVALYWTLGGFSYPLGTQNLSVTESREDGCQILSTERAISSLLDSHVPVTTGA